MKCYKCGVPFNQTKTQYLRPVDPKGPNRRWACYPQCDVRWLSQDAALVHALNADKDSQ